jgi:hypothetical protein
VEVGGQVVVQDPGVDLQEQVLRTPGQERGGTGAPLVPGGDPGLAAQLLQRVGQLGGAGVRGRVRGRGSSKGPAVPVRASFLVPVD